MYTRLLTIALICWSFLAIAQPNEVPLADTVAQEPAKSKLYNLDFLLRAGAHVTDFTSADRASNFSLDEARIGIYGNYNDQLSYTIRFRLNRSFAPLSQDNSPNALDFAYLKYKFGRDHAWSITAGKQASGVGSFEFDNSPLYEHAYSEFINHMINLFVVGGNLSYELNPQHRLSILGYSTTNSSFSEHLAKNGFVAGEAEASKTPLGGFLTWNGSFLDKKILTLWSYNIAQFAKGQNTHNIALGNKYQGDKQQVYLDFQYSHFDYDYAFVASNFINNYKQIGNNAPTASNNINYKSVVLRYDQFVSPKWEIALKGAYETASAPKDKTIGKDFRKVWTYFAALQHKPYKQKDLRFFLAYVGNSIAYSSKIQQSSEQANRLTLGTYFTIPVL